MSVEQTCLYCQQIFICDLEEHKWRRRCALCDIKVKKANNTRRAPDEQLCEECQNTSCPVDIKRCWPCILTDYEKRKMLRERLCELLREISI